MTCKMLGSMTYSILSSVQRKRHHTNVNGCGGDNNNTSIAQTRKSLRYVFLAAAISFFWTVVFKESYFVALFAFCAFEFGLGVYWPAMAVLRGELVPNSLRASVTSVFRVPLNVLVVMLLTAAGRASERAPLAVLRGDDVCLFHSQRQRRLESRSGRGKCLDIVCRKAND